MRDECLKGHSLGLTHTGHSQIIVDQVDGKTQLTSISGRQCPTGCADEEDLARAPNIFVIGMSRPKDRTTVDVLHLEDEVAKRKDRERRNTVSYTHLRAHET